jgi:hypothetical protein
MDHYQEIKPVLNKLSKYNVFDSLDVISRYIRAVINGTDRSKIQSINSSEYNFIEIFFADFLIENVIMYCTEIRGELSLRRMNDRAKIYKPVYDLHEKVSTLPKNEPLVWFMSYVFNQTNIMIPGNILVSFYRYYCLYNSDNIRAEIQRVFGFPMEYYFRSAFYLYGVFAHKDGIHRTEEYLFKTKFKKTEYSCAIEYLLGALSLELSDIREKCKSYCSYESERMFKYYNDAPHIRYPLIKCNDGYCCVVPPYIISALLDGLYYRFDSPKHANISNEIAHNFEKYVGAILEHATRESKIGVLPEITYKVKKQENKKTSDWIIWDENGLCFLDCKMKRISVEGKRAVDIDDDTINDIINQQPFSDKSKKRTIDSLPEGLTKDLIDIGIGLGKIFVCYDDYQKGLIPDLVFDQNKEFYACLVTLDESYINTPDYKKRIIQVAQGYRRFKTKRSEVINPEQVILLSVSQLEKSIERLEDMGVCKCFSSAPILQLEGHKSMFEYLSAKCNDTIIKPLMDDIIQ